MKCKYVVYITTSSPYFAITNNYYLYRSLILPLSLNLSIYLSVGVTKQTPHVEVQLLDQYLFVDLVYQVIF